MELSTRNLSRLMRSLIPPTQVFLSELCQQGYDDALEFLYKNNLISCEDCSAIELNYLTSREAPEDYESECSCCGDFREQSKVESMPDYILSVLANHVDGPNNIFTKCYKALTLPVTLPCEIAS